MLNSIDIGDISVNFLKGERDKNKRYDRREDSTVGFALLIIRCLVKKFEGERISLFPLLWSSKF